MTTLPITTFLASGIAGLLLVLSWHVIRRRRQADVSLSDGGDVILLRRTRAQANLIEYAPIFVLMIGLAEFQGGNSYIVGAIAALFLAARLAHGYALSFSENSPAARIFGAALTFLCLGAMAIYNIIVLVM